MTSIVLALLAAIAVACPALIITDARLGGLTAHEERDPS